MNFDDDPISKVLGKDQYSHVCGLGLGAKPPNFAEISTLPYCTCLNLSSKDERAVLYHLRQLKGWTQRLNKHVKHSGSSDIDEKDDFNFNGIDKLENVFVCANEGNQAYQDHINGRKTNAIVDALYLSVVTMTIVGYEDLVPQSAVGKLIACAFVFLGIALVGLILVKEQISLLRSKRHSWLKICI
ncbi:Two pore potassium channel a [Bienertia sinuspersici]